MTMLMVRMVAMTVIVVTAALVGAGAWLYLKKGDASRDGDKGRMKAK